MLGPTPKVSDLIDLVWDPRIGSSNKFSGEAAADDPEITLLRAIAMTYKNHGELHRFYYKVHYLNIISKAPLKKKWTTEMWPKRCFKSP